MSARGATSTEGTVISIHTAESAGQAMETRNEVELIAGRGIPGDRYHAGRGEFSPTPMDPDHELTLIAIEEIEAFNGKTGHAMAPGEFRRNVVTRGIDLNRLVGSDFRLGSAVIRGIRLCEPCAYLARATQRAVLPHLVGNGGLRAGIVQGGALRVGDPVRVGND